MKDVNLALGRFQPFTKGHLQMCKDGYDKNGLPAVVLLVDNNKFDPKHPFSNELVLKELDIVKKNNDFIEDVILITGKASISWAGTILNENGYVPHLWLCGDDREARYKAQLTPKYREWGKLPDDFTTYTGTGRTEGVSGTAVREAVKNGDKNEFKKLMPKGTERLFNEFQDEISKVQESSFVSLADYLEETL